MNSLEQYDADQLAETDQAWIVADLACQLYGPTAGLFLPSRMKLLRAACEKLDAMRVAHTARAKAMRKAEIDAQELILDRRIERALKEAGQ